MSVAEWPSTLPAPERRTWQKMPMDARLKRRNDSGAPGYRLRFSGVPQLINMSILVKRQGKAVFDEFFEVTTRCGSLPFWMPDWTTEGWPMTDTDGNPLFDGEGNPLLMSGRWLCLFGDTMPAETIEGIEFRKTFSVVVMP